MVKLIINETVIKFLLAGDIYWYLKLSLKESKLHEYKETGDWRYICQNELGKTCVDI